MVEIVWEFVVREVYRGQFELIFGPGGSWSKLFSKSPGYRGSALSRDTTNLNHYLAIDVWDTEDMQEQAIAECRPDYEKLDAELTEWTEVRHKLGVFSLRTQATVRPQSKTGRPRYGKVR